MDDADELRMAGLEQALRDQMDRNKVLWEKKARAEFKADNYDWLVAVWWDQRKPHLSLYASDELDAAIAAHRHGREPPAPRITKFPEWKPDVG